METGLYRKRRDELFELISFDRALDPKVADLPGGVKQQVSLAAALLHDPEIVFLDEPTAGVTPGGARAVLVADPGDRPRAERRFS